MYKTFDEAVAFIEEVSDQLLTQDKVDAVICSPALYIPTLKAVAADTSLAIGAQTMHEAEEGAFTGEISPAQLESVGTDYVVLGHSERREYYNETDEAVNRKVAAALAHTIVPIICCGETLSEREADATNEKVTTQITKALTGFTAEEVKHMVIAYEPIWAIGTGKTATADQANEVCGVIRQVVTELYDEATAQAIRIQYGGSVKPENIDELLAKEHIDGALVGGASLQPASYLALVEAGARIYG